MIALLTQFGDSTTGIRALGIDAKALIIQLVTFLLAFWVLKRYAFGPILRVLAERRKTIEQGVKLGEQMQKDKAELEAKVEAELHKARQQADGILAEASEASRQAIRAAEDTAKQKAEGIIKSAEDRIVQDTARARQQLKGEIVNLVSDATEAIIHEKVDAKKDADLIDRALKEQGA